MPKPTIAFSTSSYANFQQALCNCGTFEAGELDVRYFEDGEHYLRILNECVDREAAR